MFSLLSVKIVKSLAEGSALHRLSQWLTICSQSLAVLGRDADTDRVCANVSHVSMESAYRSFASACEGCRELSCSFRHIASYKKRLTILVE